MQNPQVRLPGWKLTEIVAVIFRQNFFSHKGTSPSGLGVTGFHVSETDSLETEVIKLK